MKQNFDRALRFVLQHECVFARGHYGDFAHVITEDVKGDAGGLTKYGIDQRSHPGVNIRELSLEQASEIYRREYWQRCRCDELPNGYDAAVFDIAVNNGPGKAVTLLQQALWVTVDGHLGPKTIAAARAAGAKGLEKLLTLRRNYYIAIVSRRPSQAKFKKGWLQRNEDLAGLVRPLSGAALAT